MAESLISDLVKLLSEKLIEEGSLLLGVTEEASILSENLQTILAVLVDAENREVGEDSVRKWLDELKDVAYDIEDILEDWEIARVQQAEVVAADQSGLTSRRSNIIPATKKVCLSCINFPVSCFKRIKSRHQIANKIIDVNKRLDGIAKRRSQFHLREIARTRERRTPETSFRKFHSVDCQKRAKQTLIHNLFHDEGVNKTDGVPIISVVGVGGIGKTTIARMIFEDAQITEFQKIWVCVSEIFDERKVANTIAHSLNLKISTDMEQQIVLSKISKAIEGRRFLLILDDVCTERARDWDQILCSLDNGSQESRILLTTRKMDVAKKLKSKFEFNVEMLSEDESWQLFSHFAFFGKTEEEHRDFDDIGREIVKRCKGLPLAIDVLGRFMFEKETTREWENVHKSRLWELLEEDVFPSLKLSYLDLPSTIKRCFALCSLFPKDTEILKDELIQLWMAHGFLQKRSEMEDVGEEYFNCLVARSFFQVVEDPISMSVKGEYVKIHDIIHDFAQHISRNEVVCVDDFNTIDCQGRLRHLMINGRATNFNIEHIGNNFDLKVLRTFFSSGTISETVLERIFQKALHLRVLHSTFPCHPKVVEDIKNLIHLRYLRFGSNELIQLSEGICRLHYLQTLDLRMCYNLRTLPKGIGKLSSLRHLIFYEPQGILENFPKGIGKLRNLHTLNYFGLFGGDENCSLDDFGELNKLQGELRIHNLNRVVNVREANIAKLHEKVGITRLTLQFGEGDVQTQLEVLEAMRPAYKELCCLRILDYEGRIFSTWITGLTYVKEVELLGMTHIEQLPPLGALSSLEKLEISGAEKVERVGLEFFGISEQQSVESTVVVFPKLRLLILRNMPQWELDLSCSVTIMPSLKMLYIINCSKIELKIVQNNEGDKKEMQFAVGNFILPRTLEIISVNGIELCGRADTVVRGPFEASSSDLETVQVVEPHLSFRYLSIDNADVRHINRVLNWIPTSLANLKSIDMSNGDNIEWLPPFGLLQYLESLTVNAGKVKTIGGEFLGIHINDAQGDSPSSSFVSFPRLEHLMFSNMHEWEKWEEEEARMTDGASGISVMQSLRWLGFSICPRLQSLPWFFEDVPLERLEICDSSIMPPTVRNIEDDQNHKPAAKMIGIPDPSTTILAKSLKSLALSRVDIDEWIQAWNKYLVNIKEVDLRSCRLHNNYIFLQMASLAALPSLEILHLYKISEIVYVGKELEDEQLKEMTLQLRGDNIGIQRQGESCPQHVQSSSSFQEINFTAFPNLKELHFGRLDNWEEWESVPIDDLKRKLNGYIRDHQKQRSDDPVGTIDNFSAVNINIMPRLRVLTFWRCPKLKALPRFLQAVKLAELKIGECPNLKTWYEDIDGGGDWVNWKLNNVAQATFNDDIGSEGWRSIYK